ncbi:hypothetical protein ABZ553_14580 [Streptomyces sparsogenes]|uniref:hypothetical protein n=1 Tax=Streptomyces sparsogenes TaxID=67365 RepID=UPI0033EB8287
MFEILRKFEIAPGVWGSTPVRVGSSVSKRIADAKMAELNAREKAAPRRLRHVYIVRATTN